MTDIDPTDPKALVSFGAMMSRGTILTCYANFEWWLAEWILQASAMPEYANLQLDFSRTIEKRLKAIKAILKADGPFNQYAAEAIDLVEKIEIHEERRNFMAHAVMGIDFETEPPTVLFRMYKMFKGGVMTPGIIHTNLDQLRNYETELTLALAEFTRLLRRVWREQGLPIMKVDWKPPPDSTE